MMHDSCLLAHELVSWISMKKQGNGYYVILKTDLYKVYDGVRPDSLIHKLRAMEIKKYG